MDLKVVFVVVCVCVLAISFTEAGIPKCCITTKRDIPARVLLKVQRWEMQESNGACDIAALILHVRGLRKPVCAHPKIRTILQRLRQKVKPTKQKA